MDNYFTHYGISRIRKIDGSNAGRTIYPPDPANPARPGSHNLGRADVEAYAKPIPPEDIVQPEDTYHDIKREADSLCSRIKQWMKGEN